MFVAEYVNGNRSAIFQPEVTTAIQTPAAFDEGGNFIRPNFGPLSLFDDPLPTTATRARRSVTTTLRRPPSA